MPRNFIRLLSVHVICDCEIIDDILTANIWSSVNLELKPIPQGYFKATV